MPRSPWFALPGSLAVVLSLVVGCKQWNTRPAIEPPPPDIKSIDIDYVDSDGFDALFESALVNRDPVITIRTTHTQPDWSGRLNAWIAAWNSGGKPTPGTRVRGQAPVPKVTVDGESIREFRLLIDSLVTRAEELAMTGSTWYREERMRAHRVALLKPYNLRFHLDDQKFIRLVFFNGDYARDYSKHVEKLTGDSGSEEWSRGIHCSMCKELRVAKERTPGRLTAKGDDE